MSSSCLFIAEAQPRIMEFREELRRVFQQLFLSFGRRFRSRCRLKSGMTKNMIINVTMSDSITTRESCFRITPASHQTTLRTLPVHDYSHDAGIALEGSDLVGNTGHAEGRHGRNGSPQVSHGLCHGKASSEPFSARVKGVDHVVGVRHGTIRLASYTPGDPQVRVRKASESPTLLGSDSSRPGRQSEIPEKKHSVPIGVSRAPGVAAFWNRELRRAARQRIHNITSVALYSDNDRTTSVESERANTDWA